MEGGEGEERRKEGRECTSSGGKEEGGKGEINLGGWNWIMVR